MLGSVLLAWSKARHFGWDIKKWRLFADVINDIGLTLDLLAPLYPQYFLFLVCLGSFCRALCGVSAGATRAALMTHFSKNGNASDLHAKEGIQETAVTLLGMLAGVLATRTLNGSVAKTWITFFLLTLLHVVANLFAVRALILDTLNKQRLCLLIDNYLDQCKIDEVKRIEYVTKHDSAITLLSPEEVSLKESVCYYWVQSRWNIQLGAPIHDLFSFSSDRLTFYRNLFGGLGSPDQEQDFCGFFIHPDLRTGTLKVILPPHVKEASHILLFYIFFLTRLVDRLGWPSPRHFGGYCTSLSNEPKDFFLQWTSVITRAHKIGRACFPEWMKKLKEDGRWDLQLLHQIHPWRCEWLASGQNSSSSRSTASFSEITRNSLRQDKTEGQTGSMGTRHRGGTKSRTRSSRYQVDKTKAHDH